MDESTLTYNGHDSVKLYSVYLQKRYKEFKKELGNNLSEFKDIDTKRNYLKKLKNRMTDIEGLLSENRNRLAHLES